MTLANQIESDLVRLLAHRQDLPFKLSLSGIAKHFGVSPMPVRTAVQRLVDAGMLTRGEAGRLLINEDRLPSVNELPSDAPGQAQDPVNAQIEDDIIRRALTEDEQYMRESATAEQYGVGRTVVRRIFSELAGRGLLEHVPRCGWLVRPYREKDAVDYLTIREFMEREALQQAFSKLDPGVLRRMHDANTHSGPGQKARLNNEMHAYWVGLCGNRYIKAFFDRETGYYATIFDYAGLNPEAVDQMVDQHRAILSALMDRDLPRALSALSEHIQSQRANVRGMIRRQQKK